jgi:diguanylate cyclase (GGDEF)-like protein
MIIDDDEAREPRTLLVIWARDPRLIGKSYALDRAGGPITIGRRESNVIALDAEGISRMHARIEHRGDCWWLVDENSTNGTLVSGERITERRLRRGDRLHIGDVILEVVDRGAPPFIDETTPPPHLGIDGLTRLPNKRRFLFALERVLKPPDLESRRFSIAMFDIDRFKRVNDTYGHLAGDEVLRHVARILQSREEGSDVIARYSGEEFAWLMTRTEIDLAFDRAEKLRVLIESHPVTFEQHTIPVTISGGVVEIDETDNTAEGLVRRVDYKLYEAKCQGRNRVIR